VTAGRSQLLSDYPSLYVLVGDFQGVVGHREGDFDFHDLYVWLLERLPHRRLIIRQFFSGFTS
jgi:hypothetical protein